MKEVSGVQQLVYEIFKEDLLAKSCITKILKNVDRNIEQAGNDQRRISRLLLMKCHLEKQLEYLEPRIRDSSFAIELPV